MNHPLSQRFVRFAESECLGSSELYYHLSLGIAEDEDLLDLASFSKEGQPVPNLFLGAVHYLLGFDRDVPLTAFYPSLSASPAGSEDDAFPAFRDFALSHRDEVIDLIGRRLVQTNEVRRCAYLFPSIQFAAGRFDDRPLALIEIGTSAGLNLLWDKYSYRYGDLEGLGDGGSPVMIQSEIRGEVPDCLFGPMPQISHRIGLDLNIVDTSDPDEAAWLRALIWPEHKERRDILDAALRRRSGFDLDLREGDGFSMIAEVINEIPEGSVPCVYHTHVANQVDRESLESFLETLAEIGKRRDVIHICNNIQPTLHLTFYKDGVEENVALARTDGHARWFEWLAGGTDIARPSV